jgi:hypothetical protein
MMEAIHSSETSFQKDPHGATSQMMAFFIVTAVETSKLPCFFFNFVWV